MMNTLENFYIYKEMKANNQINDKGIFRHKIIFHTIIHRDTGRGLPIQYSVSIKLDIDLAKSHSSMPAVKIYTNMDRTVEY